MSNSYKKIEKLSFFKRMWNKIFHKDNLLLDSPAEYTEKEVKIKAYNIIDYLRYRIRI